MSNSFNRNELLDVLRTMAILMVLSVHIVGYLNGIPNILEQVFRLGAYGVALFFVISGYLGYESVNRCDSVKSYYYKKAIRILPVYYVSLLLTFIYNCFIIKIQPVDIKWIRYIFFTNMLIPSDKFTWWNSVNFYWTMTAFVLFYITSPIIFRYINTFKTAVIWTIVFVISTPIVKELMYNFLSHADSINSFVNWNFINVFYVFLFGCITFFAVKENLIFKGLCTFFIIGIIGLISNNRSGFLVFGIFFSCIILFCILIKFKLRNKLLNQMVLLISRVSYSTYLTHYFVVSIIGEKLSHINWMLSYFIFIVISILLGSVFYYTIEKPAGDILNKKLDKYTKIKLFNLAN